MKRRNFLRSIIAAVLASPIISRFMSPERFNSHAPVGTSAFMLAAEKMIEHTAAVFDHLPWTNRWQQPTHPLLDAGEPGTA